MSTSSNDPNESEKASNAAKVCPQCGRVPPGAGARFCGKCGIKLAEVEVRHSAAPLTVRAATGPIKAPPHLPNVVNNAAQAKAPEATDGRKRTLNVALFFSVLALADLVLFGAIRFSRLKNASWLHFDTNLQINLPLQADPQQLAMTGAFLKDPCHLAHVVQCTRFNSTTVQNILHGHPPTEASKLLSQYQYDFAYKLFEDLSIQGADDELPQLTLYDGIYIDRLTRFADEWYLQPALWYITHRREEDAINTYNLFANLLRPRIAQGEWLSEPGVDDTDLPVLTDLFCVDRDKYRHGLCVAGVLLAVARTSLYHQIGDSSEDSLDISDAYERLNPTLRSSSLEAYLSLWKSNGAGTQPTPPDTLTDGQRMAWQYAVGVALRGRAAQLRDAGDVDACNEAILKSKAAFSVVLGGSKAANYFQLPASHQLTGMSKLSSSLCEPLKNSKSS